MNEVMQIDSVCNNSNVASQHISQPIASASTIIDNGEAISSSIQPKSVSTSLPVPISQITNNINAGTAPPMVLTVNQQQVTTSGTPVLKLVSPVEGGAPQLIKVVPASVVNPTACTSNSPPEQQINLNSTSTYTISETQNANFHNANTLAAVVQKMNDGPGGQSQPVEGATTTNQRAYSIVTPNQQKNQQQTTVVNVAKTVFNNGQQRVHTLATLPTNARVIPGGGNAANPPKVQILSNVVVSKQNIVINKTSLQAQRQIISNLTTQKTITSVPSKSVVVETITKNPVLQQQQQHNTTQLHLQKTINNAVKHQPIINNTINQKSIKTVNSMNRPTAAAAPATTTPSISSSSSSSSSSIVQQTQKTVKTLSPGSPQPGGYVIQKPGVKTLSPNMTNHHYNKMTNQVSLATAATLPAASRIGGGIKTLNAKNLSLVNSSNNSNNSSSSRANNMAPKPNYIGKHATQAQKMQKNSGLHVKTSRGGMPPQRHQTSCSSSSPLSPKYNQKSVINSQSGYNNQAQILQNMSSGAGKNNEVGYHQHHHHPAAAKNYPLLQHSPDHSTLSEDIGEEVRPDFSPSLSYLYQVVMLDHNYGAPPPPLSPPPVMSRTSNAQHTSPVASGGTLNGALLAAAGREREREKEREEKMAAAAYYNASGPKQRHRRHSGGGATAAPPGQTILPYTSPTSALPTPQNETRNSLVSLSVQDDDDDAGSVISSDGGPNEDGDEGEETETAPEGEGDEDGVTRCICDFDHDDGYMISCDVCLSWQHVDCMGLDRNAIPEKYQCVRCQPRHVDRKHARSIQIRKREDFMNMGTLPRETSIATNTGPVGSGSGNASDTSSDTSTAESTGEPPNTHYGRHSTGSKVSLNNNFVGKKRGAPVSLSTRRKSEPASSHNRRGSLAAAHKRQQRRESAREPSVTGAAGRRNAAAAMKKREKKVKTIKRKIKSRSSIDDDSQDSWHGVAATAYSNTMGASLMQLRQWIENYEEAVTNHYSPELRARISNIRANGTHANQQQHQQQQQQPDKQAPPTAQADVAVQKCKVSGQQLTGMKIVLASQSLTPNSPVIELRGKYMLSTQHRTSTGGGGAGGAGGLQTRQHSQRPGPFLFFYRLPRDGTEVCVDTRTYGNDARFIRRSCRPNAELRHLVEKGTLHLYVITISHVEKNSELTIKHESHDLAAVAAASSSANNPAQAAAAIAAAGIQCACGGNPQSCGLYNNRKNGGTLTETTNTNNSSNSAAAAAAAVTNSTENNTITHRKRRGRRASTPNRNELSPVPPPPAAAPPAPPPPPDVVSSPPPPPQVQPSQTPSATVTSQQEQLLQQPPPPPPPTSVNVSVEPVVASVVAAVAAPPPPPALSTRRASSHQRAAAHNAPPTTTTKTNEHPTERDKEHKEKDREEHRKETQEAKDKKKKMTREERKLEAIMKAIERMEKADQRKQELQARQAQRKDNEPNSDHQHQVHHHHHQPQKQQHQHVNKQENGDSEREAVRTRRKKRKGRARTISTNSQSSTRRRTRVNSTDSYMTSGDESLLSPPLPSTTTNTNTSSIPAQESQLEQRHTRSMTTSQDSNEMPETVMRECVTPEPPSVIQNKIISTPGSQTSDISSPGQVNAAAGLLLALANGGAGGANQSDLQKSPEADGNSSGSNSSLQSSPSTPLSSACLLVAAAVGPLEPGFKFPKTKKAIMNEWLNKSPDPLQNNLMEIQNDAIQQQQQQPQPVIDYYTGSSNSSANKSLATLVQAANLCDSPPQAGGRNSAGQGAGNAKKRWLRQAISEECDSPCSRPESPPGSSEMVAPPKKRRLARESLSSEQSFTPPTTPTMLVPPSNSLVDEDYPNNDEEFYTNEDRNATLSDCSPPTIEDQVGKETINSQRVELSYNSGGSTGVDYQTAGHDDISVEMMKDRDDDIVKKYPEALPSSLLDPRLGRDPRPVFRDSAQLLGNIEKTIRFYEENLTGPVTVAQPEIAVLPPPPQSIIPSTIQLPILETTETIINSVAPPPLPPQHQHVEIIEEITIPPPKCNTPPPIIPIAPVILNAVVIPTAAVIPTPPVVPIAAVIPTAPVVPIAAVIPTAPVVQTAAVIPTPPVVASSPVPTLPPENSPILTTPPPAATTKSVTRASTTTSSTECFPPNKKEKVPTKPEIITPTKRKVKLSISEYRQRKQLKVPADRSGNTTPERATSPETPPPQQLLQPPSSSSSTSTTLTTNVNISTNLTTVPANNTVLPPTAAAAVKTRARSRSLSTSSTSSLSSDEEIVNTNIIADCCVEQKSSVAETQVLVAFNSAPTAVERQRENVERLKKAFGLTLDDETRRSVLNNTASVTAATTTITPIPSSSTTTTIRDDAAATPPPPTKPTCITIKSPPHLLPQLNNTLTTSDLLAKIEPSSTTKLMLSMDSPIYAEKKFSASSLLMDAGKFSTITNVAAAAKRTRSPSPEKILAKNPSPEPDVQQIKKDKLMCAQHNDACENEIDEAYSKFDESVSSVYIPSFNNPVYPNSTQYTGFSSVIDTSPYEGRNPSPPPSELLKSTCYK